MTRFGVQLPNFSGFDSADLFEHVAGLATAAETAGFSSVWVMDHYFQLPPLGGPDQPMLEAYTLLGALAARTERIQLGTLVTGVTYRNPGILAKIVTTLDVISKGRAILGIGGAWYDVEHQGLGITYPSDRVRLDMLEEAVQVCRAMFTGDDVTFEGTYFRLDHARNLPRPVQPGGPRIMIGGGVRSAPSGWWRSTPTSATSPATPPPWPARSRCSTVTAPRWVGTPARST